MAAANLLLVGIGIVSCVLGSLAGLGGGFLMVPLLVALYHPAPRYAAGTVLVAMVFNSLASIWGYGRQKRIDYRSGLLFASAGVPGSIAGAYAAGAMTGPAFNTLFGIVMLIVSLSLLFRPQKLLRLPFRPTVQRRFTDRRGQEFSYEFSGRFGAAVAFAVGFLSSLLGIGGGSVMVPTMVLFLGFPPHIAGATSMFMILISSLVGGGMHAFLGDVMWGRVLWLAPGAFIGGRLGSWMAPRVPGVWMVRILGTFMALVAVQLIVH